MPKKFSVHEINREENETIFITIVADEIIHYVSTVKGSGVVKIERTGNAAKTYTKTGDIYLISSEILEEFCPNGHLETEEFELDNTKLPIPGFLRQITCTSFKSAFLGDQRGREWLRLVNGWIEVLKMTEIGEIEGIGEMEQILRVKRELVICGSDISDEQLQRIGDYGTMVLDSFRITEKGVKEKLEKWLELPERHIFEIRFKPISPDFVKNWIFKDLKKAEIKWKQYFEFKMKYTQQSGKTENFNGYYFVAGEFNLIKIMSPTIWKPNSKIPT
uniref:FBA_2 domain-containing protein n=1 Tax=Caenorhabditis tropicalis TaxID=1561998 RepID=A0A1I7U6V1_9PELO